VKARQGLGDFLELCLLDKKMLVWYNNKGLFVKLLKIFFDAALETNYALLLL